MIAAVKVFWTQKRRFWLCVAAGLPLGIILLISGLGKLPSQTGFLAVMQPLPFLTPWVARLVAYVLPWAELVVGVLLLLGIFLPPAAVVASLMVLGFIANNLWAISNGLGYQPCGCFGVFERFRLLDFSTQEAMLMDIGMMVLTVIIVLVYPLDSWHARPWFLERLGENGNRKAE